MAEKHDPIREKYYKPLEWAERCAGLFFYAAATLSLLVLIEYLKQWPGVYSGLQIAFLTLSVVGFFLGMAIRLYYAPRAEKKRREDLFSHALGISLTHERTAGYYNNQETEPYRRLGMNVLENSFHSKDTATEMCKRDRLRVLVYAVAWLALLSTRSVELGWIIVAAQALFSEQLISRWLRLEWLRNEVERVYDGLLRIFHSQPEAGVLQCLVIEQLTTYEGAKARAGITLSARIFDRRNEALSAEWNKVRAALPHG